MKLRNLHAENIRSYKKLDFTFEDGVTVISGVNGSGKSSLLEACFMGLFGSKILSKDFVLSDIIFKGAENAKISLGFEHLGHEYLIDQAFRYSVKSENASSSKCVLYADGKIIVDQAIRTYEEVCSLLNMDEEAYRNCAYIRQGEIDVLINAKPKDRQLMIDDLMQLGKLEDYRERASSAKTAVKRLERDTKNSQLGVKAEIEEIESTGPVAVLNELRQKVKKTDIDLKDLNEMKEAATSRKEKHDLMIMEYTESLKETEILKQSICESQGKKDLCFREKETFTGEVHEQRQILLELGEENNTIKRECGFEDIDIELLVVQQEKKELLAREKINEISKKLALHFKDEEALKQILRELEKEKFETEDVCVYYKKNVGTTSREIEGNRTKIRRTEEENRELKRKAKFEEANEISSVIKELEEKESFLRDQKSEVSAKLILALKEKEIRDLNFLELEKELQNYRGAIQKGQTEVEALEAELKENSTVFIVIHEQKSEVFLVLKELNFTGEQLEDLEDFSELLLENKNRLHGREKELEAILRELENVLRKYMQLLSEGKCPTCGQDLEDSDIVCATDESGQKKEKISLELMEIKVQQAEIEKKLNRLKDAKKLKKRISDFDLETEKLGFKEQDLEERMKIHKSRIMEDSAKLEVLNTRKQKLEAEIKKFLPDIKALQGLEEAAQKTHNEIEEILRDAKVFEKKIAENKAEIEVLSGEIRTSLALIKNYDQRLQELNDKLRGLSERENLEKEKLKSLEIYLEDLRKKEEEAKKNHKESEKVLTQVKKIHTNLLRIDNIKYKISELDTSIRNLTEKVGFFDRDILERSEKIKKLDEKLEGNSLEDLQLKRAQFEEAQANITEKIGLMNATKDSFLKEIGMVENNLKRLKELKNELKDLENKLLYLEAIYSNSEELENIYMLVRADMRAQNIDALSALLNEMFSFMYANNAYSHIELDSEYNLTVYRKDGTPLEPKLLSGGERAIFNLILRCAIYRLLSLGFGGDRADGLPPMILDEPTVFLDRGHIRQLLQLIDMMRNIGVGQIIVVSHDESLIDSADHIFQVEKDPLTNMSSIVRL